MGKRESFQDLPLADRASGEEVWRWLYEQLRRAIVDGRLKAGSRLPSTRSLAIQHSVARGTVQTVFDQLQAEGYTEALAGSGTFVASRLPDRSINARRGGGAPAAGPTAAAVSSRMTEVLRQARVLPQSKSVGKAFRMYEPAVDLFPVDLWARITGRVLRRAPRILYGQGSANGSEFLRREIAGWLGTSRGVRCSPGQVIVTSGAQQALDLAARVLLDPEDRVVVEDPCYPGAHLLFAAAGARLLPMPVDEHGIRLSGARAKLAYVTPANHFPLGVTMSVERRLHLLRWAADNGAWIIEDEYDAEYKYTGRPMPALQSLDRSGSVLYVGTYTKMLFNALRIGFVVVPERLVDLFCAAKSVMDRHAPSLQEAVLAEFIAEGHFGRHVRQMRQVYAERLDALVQAAEKRLAGVVDVRRAEAGMRTIGWLRPDQSDVEVVRRAAGVGLEMGSVSSFTLANPKPPALVLGFAGCTPEELRRGVDVLAAVLDGATASAGSR